MSNWKDIFVAKQHEKQKQAAAAKAVRIVVAQSTGCNHSPNDVCDCSCHSGGKAHEKPCCSGRCSGCGENIEFGSKQASNAKTLRVVVAQPIEDDEYLDSDEGAPVGDEARSVEEQVKGKGNRGKVNKTKYVSVDGLGVSVPFQEVSRYQEPFKPTIDEQTGVQVIELIHAYLINMGMLARTTQQNINKLEPRQQKGLAEIYKDLDTLGSQARQFSRDKTFDSVVSNENYQQIHPEIAIRRYKTWFTLVEELYLNVVGPLGRVDRGFVQRGMSPLLAKHYADLCEEIKSEIAALWPEFYKSTRTDVRDKMDRLDYGSDSSDSIDDHEVDDQEINEVMNQGRQNSKYTPKETGKMHNFRYRGQQFGEIPGWSQPG